MTSLTIFLHGELFDKNGNSSAIGIRYMEISRALSKNGHNVRLAVPKGLWVDRTIPDLRIVTWTKADLASMAKASEMCLIPQTMGPLFYSRIPNPPPTVVDLVVPLQLEALAMGTGDSFDDDGYLHGLYSTAVSIRKGDFFICGSERQRLYYLGHLTILGRLTPETYGRNLIGVVRQGAPSSNPVHTLSVFRNKIVSESDLAVLWAGGLYPWYDIDVTIRAMDLVCQRVKNAKLVVVGGDNPLYPASRIAVEDAKRLSRKLGLLGKTVHFIDWIPFEHRASMYLEANLAVSTHKPYLEAVLSTRSRISEYAWAGLPIVCTRGDEISELLQDAGAGISVPAGDPEALATALLSVLENDNLRTDMGRRSREFASGILSWSETVRALESFCRNPESAHDLKGERRRSSKYTRVVRPVRSSLAEGRLKVRQLLKLVRG